jgi:hypothetical protein
VRKHAIALLGFLAGVVVYYNKAPLRDTASVQDDFHQEEFVSTTLSAPAKRSSAPPVPVTIIDEDFSKEELETISGLPRGMKLASNVRAIPEEEYTEGKILLKKNGFIFLRSQGTGANVVYDQRLNTFHPLTATIKLSGVTSQKREEILRSWEEFHYNADLGVQFIQSSPEKLFDDFAELKKTGVRVSLEVIQAVYQAR